LAYFEFNALSVVLCGSFAARVFLPEMDKLQLDDAAHTKKYPVLVLLHSEGGAAVDWQTTPAERCAKEHGIFIVAPDVQHTLGTNMEYGPKYETFVSGELLAICRNIFPVSADPAETWIGGAGTGAYGAVKTALDHPDVFSKAFSINGVLDMSAIVQRALAGKDTGICHDAASLEAVFGRLDGFAGGENDLFALARKPARSRFFFLAEEDNAHRQESAALADQLGLSAEQVRLVAGSDCHSQQQSLPMAVRWAVAGKEGK
jgi:S-formylglutathione hydrolase FrmB